MILPVLVSHPVKGLTNYLCRAVMYVHADNNREGRFSGMDELV